VAPRLPRAAFVNDRALRAVQLSPDGRYVAYLREQGQSGSLWLLPTAGGPARNLLQRTDADAVDWSRDGRWLFVRTAKSLSMLDIRSGTGMRIGLRGP
jgi:dipeptidyl aminopeptidase/acylaminoacyl peptidase